MTLNILFLFPNLALNSAVLNRWRGLDFFQSTIIPNAYEATGIQTHARVAPDWDLLDALPTELHGRGNTD